MHSGALPTTAGLIQHGPLSHDAVADYDEAILVAGSRGFNDYDKFVQCFEPYLLQTFPRSTCIFITGAAKSGPDSMIIRWCRENGRAWTEFPAEWDNLAVPGAVVRPRRGDGKMYNVVAGHQRNRKMAEVMTQACIFWDGLSPGTRNMIEEAQKVKVDPTIFLVDPDIRKGANEQQFRKTG